MPLIALWFARTIIWSVGVGMFAKYFGTETGKGVRNAALIAGAIYLFVTLRKK